MLRATLFALAVPLAASADPLWTTAIGKDAGATFLAVTGDTVVAASWTSDLVGLDAATGKERWRHPHAEVAGTQLLAAVAGGKAIAAVPERADVTGYDAATGKQAWTRTLSSPVDSMASCPGHRLVAVTHRARGADGATTLMVHALDPADGKDLWMSPAAGGRVGSAPGWLFVAEPSGTGLLRGRLSALRCADGAVTELPAPERRFESFLAADAGRVVSSTFEFGFNLQQVCVTDLASRARTCFEPTDGSLPAYPVTGALLRGDEVWVSTAHIEAHNLNPAPDSAIFRYDLKAKRFIGVSEPLTSNGLFAEAGDQVVTGFGTTGIADAAYVLDGQTKRTATVALAKAPRQVAADAARGYIATYDGAVVALALPAPGRAAAVEQPVEPRALPVPPPPADLGFRKLSTFDAHPPQAKSSGSMGEGFLYDVAFLDADTLAVGGNDDRAAVFGVDGQRRWRSPALGKDVQRVAGCLDGFAAQTYQGDVALFVNRGKGFRQAKRIKAGFGWAFGVTPTCDVLVDDFDGNFTLYDAKTAKSKQSFRAPGNFDRRGVRVTGSLVIISEGEELRALDLSDGLAVVARWSTPKVAHGGGLTQAWLLRDGRLLREYCGPPSCVVVILAAGGGGVVKTLTFDTTGAGWSPTVPSMIATTPDGSALAFFRRQLDLTLVDVATDRRQPLVDLAGPQSGLLQAAFSPDGRRLAIVGHPRGWQVTILERTKAQ
ncbi:MAG: PQQ-binding-like beta-propeller repeat protein [bacterium]